jgi:hypothetical protein
VKLYSKEISLILKSGIHSVDALPSHAFVSNIVWKTLTLAFPPLAVVAWHDSFTGQGSEFLDNGPYSKFSSKFSQRLAASPRKGAYVGKDDGASGLNSPARGFSRQGALGDEAAAVTWSPFRSPNNDPMHLPGSTQLKGLQGGVRPHSEETWGTPVSAHVFSPSQTADQQNLMLEAEVAMLQVRLEREQQRTLSQDNKIRLLYHKMREMSEESLQREVCVGRVGGWVGGWVSGGARVGAWLCVGGRHACL